MFNNFTNTDKAIVVLSDFNVTQNCQFSNGHEWSSWSSTSENKDGNDFETLYNHRIKNKNLCASPYYIEAREKNSTIDWLGSKSTLIHLTNYQEIRNQISGTNNQKLKPKPKWAYGLSIKFG